MKVNIKIFDRTTGKILLNQIINVFCILILVEALRKCSYKIFIWESCVFIHSFTPGVPNKVHKFKIQDLCSEIRSISKVGVIC